MIRVGDLGVLWRFSSVRGEGRGVGGEKDVGGEAGVVCDPLGDVFGVRGEVGGDHASLKR
jgi:hypothetical protein